MAGRFGVFDEFMRGYERTSLFVYDMSRQEIMDFLESIWEEVIYLPGRLVDFLSLLCAVWLYHT